jgi:hypothetical protein
MRNHWRPVLIVHGSSNGSAAAAGHSRRRH